MQYTNLRLDYKNRFDLASNCLMEISNLEAFQTYNLTGFKIYIKTNFFKN